MNTPTLDICKNYIKNDSLVSWYITSKSDPTKNFEGTYSFDISNRSTDLKDPKVTCLSVNPEKEGNCNLSITDDKNNVSKLVNGKINIPPLDTITKLYLNCEKIKDYNKNFGLYIGIGVFVISLSFMIGWFIYSYYQIYKASDVPESYYGTNPESSSENTKSIGGYFDRGE